MIKIENLSKSFSLTKKQQKESGIQTSVLKVVDNISFSCQPGRVFSLLGPNGAGKTTTLRMLATILKPDSGSIQIAGYDTQHQPIEVRKRLGFLTGSTGLYQRLTPFEVVKYFADLNHVPASAFKQRQEQLFQQLNMNDFAHKQIGSLSTGQKQKTSIARTMINDPEVVVFDEPTSGLDVITAEAIIDLIRHCKDAGKTVIFSSHIMSEVDLLCDDLAIVHKGKLVYTGTMEAFRNNMQAKNLTEEFIRVVRNA